MPKAKPVQKPARCVWKGPCSNDPNGGVTQSLIASWLVCQERFRARYILGLQPPDDFNHRIEYGSMWHVCEEELARTKGAHDNWDNNWERALLDYCRGLAKQYRTQQDQVQHWYNVVRMAFPVYVQYWKKHKDVQQRTPLLQEETFSVPYPLPSGRVVQLRGKWDSVDIIGKGKHAAVYLQENKTKGDIEEGQLKRQLSSGFDLQTMLYLVALEQYAKANITVIKPASDRRTFWGDSPLGGVRYNVVRRPLSGGRHSIRQTQKETLEQFYERLGGLIASEPDYFFMRWRVEIQPNDLMRFRTECLNPILEGMCDWWEWIAADLDNPFRTSGDYRAAPHFRYPYGVYSPLLEGGEAEVDEYLNTGSTLRLAKVDTLFKELT